MKILVCITHVPDTTSKISFTDNDTKFDPNQVTYIIGPYDDYALARAVEVKDATGGSVTVLNVGTAESDPSLRKALAIGADNAIRIDAAPTDSFFVAEQIAAHAKDEAYDLILMGRESIDFNGGMVHGMVGELLDLPAFSPVMKLEIEGEIVKMDREIEGGKESLGSPYPLVAGCQEPIAEWKIPNLRGIMQAKSKPLEVIPAVGKAVQTENLKYSLPPKKAGVKLVDKDNVQELVELLKNEAKVL